MAMEQYLQFAANHLILFALLGVAVMALIANEIHGNLTGGKRLSAGEAVRLINDRDPVILDVRAAADFKRGHLLNAVNIPLAKVEEQLGQIGKDKARPVLVYCALGSSSVTAVEKLRKNGYSEAYPLSGGINGWLANNLPVTIK
jgi:rhodanese-related sulfurtransferase